MSKRKRLPDMSQWTAQQIHEFWKTHSSADYWDETEEVEVTVRKQRRKPVSIKLSEADLKCVKQIARARGLGYTTLLRLWVKEKLREAQAA